MMLNAVTPADHAPLVSTEGDGSQNSIVGVSVGDGTKLRRFILKNANRPAFLWSTPARTVADLKADLQHSTGIPVEEQLISSSTGLLACDAAELCLAEFSTLVVRAKCLGGKGGFGAMLRGQASRPGMKKVESNTGAMRDLSGRRLRHVEQESKLEEWAAEEAKRKAERELEKQKKKQKLYERTHEAAEQYVAEATINPEEVSSAVLEGIQEAKKKAAEKTSEEEERKKQEAIAKAKKLGAMWGDGDEGSDDSGDGDDAPPAPQPKPSQPPAAPAAAPKAAEAPPAAATEPSAVSNGSAPAQAPAAAAAGAPSEAAAPAAQGVGAEAEDIDVEAVAEVGALEGMGAERLKGALLKRGLKCGGTLEQRAQRLWSVRGLARENWPAAALQPPPKK